MAVVGNFVAFDKLDHSELKGRILTGIDRVHEKVTSYKASTDGSFDAVIGEYENISIELDDLSSIFFYLYSAYCTDPIEEAAEEVQTRLTQLGNDLTLDQGIFLRIQHYYDHADQSTLTTEQKTLMDKTYKAFVRNGALLDDEGKEKLREIDGKLAALGVKFSQNVLKATNAYELVIEDDSKLKGIPDRALEQAKAMAKAKGKEGHLFNLQMPSFIPAMTYAQDAQLREELYRANAGKASAGEFDNSELVIEIAKLRKQRANLLGHDTHAHFVLDNRMAKTPDKVTSFIEELYAKAKPKATEEFERLKKLKAEIDGDDQVRPWDVMFLSEKLKQREIGLNEEELRPYFSLDQVLSGMFEVANRLYGINFEQNKDYPVYDPDVRVYEVNDANGFVGLFYADFFPRENKRGGAWMTNLREVSDVEGDEARPHVGIVCNFTKATESTPSLLSLNEVLTLFHEFGHALHGLLTTCKYRSVAGASVLWDFVELPSQIMENWIYERECLDLIAKHYQTGESLPDELIQKVQKDQQFLEGLATLRQLSFGHIDMAWHYEMKTAPDDILEFEESYMGRYNLLPGPKEFTFSTAFSHIFAGGYSAGYYSYKWAEVLDADAFSLFKEKGLFSPEVAGKFREHILEKGGSDDPALLYRNFRGRDPDVSALLERAGLA